jgi:hypothetical protein
MGDLDATSQRVLERHGAFFDTLDTTEMVKGYKMLVLLAMLNADRFPGSIVISDLADHVAQLASRTMRAAADLGLARHDRKALIRLLEQNPLAAWARGIGFEFSTAFWNAGFAKRPGHIFLLATLDKSGHGSEFQYKDHFISRNEFEWQSQNRTSQQSTDGQDIRQHGERGFAVHLFVRGQKKMPRGRAAPFIYCGDVQFVEWHGNRPITVKWKLPSEVPDGVWVSLGGTEPNAT